MYFDLEGVTSGRVNEDIAYPLSDEIIDWMSSTMHISPVARALSRTIGVGSAISSPLILWQDVVESYRNTPFSDYLSSPAYGVLLDLDPPSVNLVMETIRNPSVGAAAGAAAAALLFGGGWLLAGAFGLASFTKAMFDKADAEKRLKCMAAGLEMSFCLISNKERLSRDELIFLRDIVRIAEPALNKPARGALYERKDISLEKLFDNIKRLDLDDESLFATARVGLQMAHADADYDNLERSILKNFAQTFELDSSEFEKAAATYEKTLFEERLVGKASFLAVADLLRYKDGSFEPDTMFALELALTSWVPVHRERLELIARAKDTFKTTIALSPREAFEGASDEQPWFFARALGESSDRDKRADLIIERVAKVILLIEDWRTLEQHQLRKSLAELAELYESKLDPSALFRELDRKKVSLSEPMKGLVEAASSSSSTKREPIDTGKLEALDWYRVRSLGGGRFALSMGKTRHTWSSSLDSFEVFCEDELGRSLDKPLQIYIQPEDKDLFELALGPQREQVEIHLQEEHEESEHE